MKGVIVAAFGAVVMLAAAPSMAQLERITEKEAIAGLKAALEKGSQAAVAALGRTDGFLANPKVKIPIPETFARAESLMRRVGMGRYADEVIVSMKALDGLGTGTSIIRKVFGALL